MVNGGSRVDGDPMIARAMILMPGLSDLIRNIDRR